ncbi:MAG: shikimate dehydrogenase [Verrucomicrobiales bacterium]
MHLTPPARVGVMGDPVAHSRSPQMHNPALTTRRIDAQYVRLHIRPHEFVEAVQTCRAAGMTGVNCTIPHKLAALEIADELDPLAQRLGAVNTLVFRDGRIYGHNTDGPGLRLAVEDEFDQSLSDQRILILGAGGGAGRAAAMQCALTGCRHLTLVNRTPGKLTALARELASVLPSDRITVQSEPNALEVDLIVNATPLGMKADDPPPMDFAHLHRHHNVYDMIYSPPETPLIAAARAAGARAANGLSMLLHQGAAAFDLWFGKPVPIEAMRLGLNESFDQ